MPIHAGTGYDGMRIIRQLPTSFDNFGDLSDYALRKITSNNLTYIFLSSINIGMYVSGLANVPEGAEVDLSESVP